MSKYEPNLFDFSEAIRRQEIGMSLAAESKTELLNEAKRIAIELGRQQEFVTMDDVYLTMLETGFEPRNLGNSSGSVFKNRKVWMTTGMVRKSSRVETHAHIQRIWKLV